jgi:hypothetical protein
VQKRPWGQYLSQGREQTPMPPRAVAKRAFKEAERLVVAGIRRRGGVADIDPLGRVRGCWPPGGAYVTVEVALVTDGRALFRNGTPGDAQVFLLCDQRGGVSIATRSELEA